MRETKKDFTDSWWFFIVLLMVAGLVAVFAVQ